MEHPAHRHPRSRELVKAIRAGTADLRKKMAAAKKAREAEKLAKKAVVAPKEETSTEKLKRLLKEQQELDEAVRQAIVAVYRRKEDVEQAVNLVLADSGTSPVQPVSDERPASEGNITAGVRTKVSG